MSSALKFMGSACKTSPLARLRLHSNHIPRIDYKGNENQATMAKNFTTFRDVVSKQDKKISIENPIEATEQFIKYDQDWPINKEKDDDDKSSPSKKQKTSSSDGDVSKKLSSQLNPEKKSLSKEKYTALPFTSRKDLNDDTRTYTFKHPFDSIKSLDIGIGQHILCAFPTKSGEIIERPYAITRPTGADKEDGTIDILVKVAMPSEKDPGGSLSNILDTLDEKRGDEMLIRGPEGPISYVGAGEFSISHEGAKPKPVKCKKVNFISGGTGMTPIYATIRHILENESDGPAIRFMDSNPSKDDILMYDHLNKLAEKYEKFDIIHVLEKKESGFEGEEGLPDKEKFERRLFGVEDGTISLVCGPPPMMKAAKEGLTEMGFADGETFFHY